MALTPQDFLKAVNTKASVVRHSGKRSDYRLLHVFLNEKRTHSAWGAFFDNNIWLWALENFCHGNVPSYISTDADKTLKYYRCPAYPDFWYVELYIGDTTSFEDAYMYYCPEKILDANCIDIVQ